MARWNGYTWWNNWRNNWNFYLRLLQKLNPLLLGDFAAAPLLLGQALGRFGNFMNGEIHGVPVFTPWKVIFQ